MSKWTNFRDSLVDVLKENSIKVTDDLKEKAGEELLNNLLPIAEERVADIQSQLREQAKSEKGWVKVRDSIVYPALLTGVVYIVKNALTKTIKKTA